MALLSDAVLQFLCTQDEMGFTLFSEEFLYSFPHSLVKLLEMTLCPKNLEIDEH